MNTLAPRVDVLPAAQRRLWDEFRDSLPSSCVLYGGTALAAQKVRVVQVRAERKDYLDLMTLLANGVTLPAALGAAQALYADFAPLITLKALSYFEDGDLGALPDQVRHTLANAAAAVHTPTPLARLSERLSEW